MLDWISVGGPVVDVVAERQGGLDVRVVPVTFTYGQKITATGRGRDAEVSVGKAALVSRLQALIATGRIIAPAILPYIGLLQGELLVDEIRVSDAGNDQYGAFMVGSHDDLVTALGLATLLDPVERYRGPMVVAL